MANVLNRTTKQYLLSVNTPDYPVSDWIINPDMTAVQNCVQKYWVIEGDLVRPMTAEEQAAYDLANPDPVSQPAPVLTALADGTPAFLKGEDKVAINGVLVPFFLQSKYALSGAALSISNAVDLGYTCLSDMAVLSVWASATAVPVVDVTLELYDRTTQQLLLSFVLPSGTASVHHVPQTLLRVQSGVDIGVRFRAVQDSVLPPSVVLDMHKV